MLLIPQELIEQITSGNVLLFVGERALRDPQGRVLPDVLAEELVMRMAAHATSPLPPEIHHSFPQAAQLYEDYGGRHNLVHFVRECVEQLGGDEPQPLHRLIAALSDINLLVTTCFDGRLERALREAGRPYHVIVNELDVAFEDERKVLVYKLRGSSDRPDSLILTEDDYETFFESDSNISVVLQSYLARKTILFVGYDLGDTNFRRLYRKVTERLDNYARRAYAFGESPSPAISGWGRRHGVQIITADTQAFLEALTTRLREQARPAPAPDAGPNREPVSPPPLPYRHLDYYDRTDAASFFGRERESYELSARIHAHRLVLLHGGSGVGKTSLLLAGVVPRLEETYTCLYVRILGDPVDAIRLQLQRCAPAADLPAGATLVDLCSAGATALHRPLLLIFDQFEEYFIRLAPEMRLRFASELQALHGARDVPAKIVLSLREDWLAAISELEDQLPTVFQTRMRLLPLTLQQARQAIVGPIERAGISYEPALVEQLLADLTESTGTIMPPQLQIVCSTLYASLGPGEQVMTLTRYERLGRARGVLLRYLDEELARLALAERDLARQILEEMVTSQRTKRIATRSELRQEMRKSEAEIDGVVEKLVQARLLRSVEAPTLAEPAFELAHEYLIEQITLSPEAKARKEAEELLQRGVETWQQYGALLAEDALALIEERRPLLQPTPQEADLLVRSAQRYRRRGERVVIGTMGGLVGGAIGGLLAASVHAALGFTPPTLDPATAIQGNTIVITFSGLLLGLAISLGYLFSKHRLAPVLGAMVAGMPLGLAWAIIFEPGDKPPVVPALLGGLLLGGGIGLSITLAPRFTSNGSRFLAWALLGGLAGALFGAVAWRGNLQLAPALAAASISIGIGFATLRAHAVRKPTATVTDA